MNWRKYVPIVLISAFYAVSLLSVWKFGQHDGHTKGVIEGIDAYHQICYNGYPPTQIMDNNTGTVVICAPMVKVPQEEIKKLKPDT